VTHSASFDQAVATLRGLRDEIGSAAAGPAVVRASSLHCWMEKVDSVTTDLLEVQRRVRYEEALAIAAALVDVALEGPTVSRTVSSCGEDLRAQK